MSTHLRSLTLSLGALACALALVAGPALSSRPAGAVTGTNDATVTKAVAWLKTQQQADGGFEVAGSPGFETPDAALALAEAAHTGATWSTAQALTAVQAVTNGGGKSPLDSLHAFASSGITAGQAAKLIVLDVEPLGLDPTAFGGVSLVQILNNGVQPNGSYGTFNGTLYAALADRLVTGSVPANTLALVRSAQQANGGWSFTGDPTGTDIDPDTTGLAVQALVAGGAPPTDPNVQKALAFLATQQDADGSWKTSFDNGNPNSTALAALAIAAAGADPTSSCWRDTLDPAKAGSPYVAPGAYLRAQQAADGHIASPNDSFGVNTFGTTQAVEALLASWLPIARDPLQACATPAPASTTTTTAAPTTTTVPTQVLGEQVENGATAPGELPRTGSDAALLAALGAGLVLLGGAVLAAARRRRAAGEA